MGDGGLRRSDLFDQQLVADQFGHPVTACALRLTAAGDHLPLGTPVPHRRGPVGLPGVDGDDLAHVQVDAAKRSHGRIGRTAPAQNVEHAGGHAADHGCQHQLGRQPQAQVGRQCPGGQPDGQHQQVESACQQLQHDGSPAQQPPDGGIGHDDPPG